MFWLLNSTATRDETREKSPNVKRATTSGKDLQKATTTSRSKKRFEISQTVAVSFETRTHLHTHLKHKRRLKLKQLKITKWNSGAVATTQTTLLEPMMQRYWITNTARSNYSLRLRNQIVWLCSYKLTPRRPLNLCFTSGLFWRPIGARCLLVSC